MKKRIVAVMICAALLTGMLGGCGQSTSDKSEEKAEKELVFWTLQQSSKDIEAAQNEVVKEFEEENNCKVEITAFPYTELRDKLINSLIHLYKHLAFLM